MIQPATLPAAAKMLLAIDPQAVNGDVSALDAQFSALLAANFMAPAAVAPGKAEAVPTPEMSSRTQLHLANGKPTGKATGKVLPDSPALAAFAAMLKQLRGTKETGGNTITAQQDENAPAGSDTAPDLPAPAFAVPVTVNPVLVPATAADDIAPELPLAVAEPAQTKAVASSQIQPLAANAPFRQPSLSAPAKPKGDAPTAEQSPALSDQTTPAPEQVIRTNPATLESLAFVERTAAAPVQAATTKPVTTDSPASELPQSRPESQPLVIQSGLTTRVLLVPRSLAHPGELAKLQTMAIEQAKTGEAGQQIARVQVRQAAEDHAAWTVTALPQVGAEPLAAATEPARNRSVTTSNVDGTQETARSALPQMDAPPLLPADPGAALDAAPAGATSQAPATAPSRTPDFAALIDRLVEARAAAQATREPHTVSAAIQHADFGEVSLQFRHDTAGLSVVMASADPDLAKALQVAAPSGGSFARQFSSSDDGNAPQWRNDQAGQSASSPSSSNIGQPQSQTQQHRSQAPQRSPDQPNGSANPAPRSRGQADQTARSGIFA